VKLFLREPLVPDLPNDDKRLTGVHPEIALFPLSGLLRRRRINPRASTCDVDDRLKAQGLGREARKMKALFVFALNLKPETSSRGNSTLSHNRLIILDIAENSPFLHEDFAWALFPHELVKPSKNWLFRG
jgi:hypothetical protein